MISDGCYYRKGETWIFYGLKVDFHSVQNVARLIFSKRFLLKCVKSSTANEICSA